MWWLTPVKYEGDSKDIMDQSDFFKQFLYHIDIYMVHFVYNIFVFILYFYWIKYIFQMPVEFSIE